MEYSSYLYKIIGAIAVVLFLIPQPVFAESTISVSNNGEGSQNDINVQSNTGGNTICQNGNCTTSSGGTSHATVCINGKCQTSDGNMDMQSDNGNDQVHIINDASGSSVTTSPVPTDVPVSLSPEPSISISPVPTANLRPTIAQMRDNIHQQIKNQIQEFKKHIKDQDAVLSSLMQSLQDFFDGLFK